MPLKKTHRSGKDQLAPDDQLTGPLLCSCASSSPQTSPLAPGSLSIKSPATLGLVQAESEGGLVRPSQYFWYAVWNMSLHLSFASSREQMRNEPPILRWSEYVSSGGGVSRCLSITGMRLWILSVVDWAPNSKASTEAKASPRIITASTWAFIIDWTHGGKKHVYLVSAKVDPTMAFWRQQYHKKVRYTLSFSEHFIPFILAEPGGENVQPCFVRQSRKSDRLRRFYLGLKPSQELHLDRFLQNSLSVALGSWTDYLRSHRQVRNLSPSLTHALISYTSVISFTSH